VTQHVLVNTVEWKQLWISQFVDLIYSLHLQFATASTFQLVFYRKYSEMQFNSDKKIT